MFLSLGNDILLRLLPANENHRSDTGYDGASNDLEVVQTGKKDHIGGGPPEEITHEIASGTSLYGDVQFVIAYNNFCTQYLFNIG